MLYMFLAAAPLTARAAAGMAGLAPSRFSVLALLMALFMVGYVVRVADRLPLRTPALAVASAIPAPMATPSPPDIPATAIAPATASGPAPAGRVATTARRHLAPRCAALCKIAMGLTMAYMLVLML
jgi:hypothetical protein